MKNLKDIISTICGILVLISGLAVSLSAQGIVISPSLNSVFIIVGTVSASIIAYLTGKNPNGSTKTIDPDTGQQDTQVK